MIPPVSVRGFFFALGIELAVLLLVLAERLGGAL